MSPSKGIRRPNEQSMTKAVGPLLALLLLQNPSWAAWEHGVTLDMPPSPDAVELLAAHQAKDGKFTEALKTINDGLKAGGKKSHYLFLRAQLNDDLDEPNKAIADYEAAWKCHELDEASLTIAAWKLHHLGGNKPCLEICNQLVNSKDKRLMASAYFVRARLDATAGKNAEAIKDYEQCYKLKRAYIAASLYEPARICLNDGQYKAAIDKLNMALAIMPGHEEPTKILKCFTWRAEANIKLGHWHEALADYNQAIAMAPEERDLYIGRAGVYKKIGDFKRAELDLKKTVDIDRIQKLELQD